MKSHLFVAITIGLLAAGCSGGTASVDDEAARPAPPPAIRDEPAPTIDIDEPAEEARSAPADEKPPALAPRYIGDTAGQGIAVRQACEQDAREQTAWSEGTLVRLIGTGDAKCDGWSYVAGPGVASWVRDEYLVSQRPVSYVVALPPNGPMFLYGSATPQTTVGITIDKRFCRQTIVDSQGRWSTAIGPSDECAPQPGDTLTFSRNGVLTPTVYAYSWIPNVTRAIAFTN